MNKSSTASAILLQPRQSLLTRSIRVRSLCSARYGRREHSPRISRLGFPPQRGHGGVLLRNVVRIEQQRHFFLHSIPTILLPPIAFTGLLLALWVYKCMMMVLFQDKIIYMPYIPPFSRTERIEDYTAACKPVEWKSAYIPSLDGTKLAICIGSLAGQEQNGDIKRHMVICYFQGNAGSSPPRLPGFSSILKRVEELERPGTDLKTRYTMVALSYRGYWTSSGRASQTGIELDSQAFLRWVNEHYSTRDMDLRVILWGQSIGAGVAASTAAYQDSVTDTRWPYIHGVVLETPFSSIRSMLSAIYPQKWLPYGYLWPFLWNHWDSEAALRKIARQNNPPRILLVPADKDEIVPSSEANKLESLCKDVGLNVARQNVAGALHNEATTRQVGREAVASFISDIAHT